MKEQKSQDMMISGDSGIDQLCIFDGDETLESVVREIRLSVIPKYIIDSKNIEVKEFVERYLNLKIDTVEDLIEKSFISLCKQVDMIEKVSLLRIKENKEECIKEINKMGDIYRKSYYEEISYSTKDIRIDPNVATVNVRSADKSLAIPIEEKFSDELSEFSELTKGKLPK